jgi:hypothetical protein
MEKQYNIQKQFDSFVTEKRYKDSTELSKFLQAFKLHIEEQEQFLSRAEILAIISTHKSNLCRIPLCITCATMAERLPGRF